MTNLLFAAAHGLTQGPLQALAIFPVSLLFGLALERTRRLAAPIALHLYFNALLWLDGAARQRSKQIAAFVLGLTIRFMVVKFKKIE